MIALSSFSAERVKEQLVAFNPNWQKYLSYLPEEEAIEFEHDWQLVQFHHLHVISVLEDANKSDLDRTQKSNRRFLIDHLKKYCSSGRFPINAANKIRTPVFIDEAKTRCAVGYLLDVGGQGKLSLDLAKYQNLAWVKDIQSTAFIKLLEPSGLTLEEVKLIQGAYDFYPPAGLYASNKHDIPQKPQVISKMFDEQKPKSLFDRSHGQWLYGEEKNGKLHGKWIQNYSADLPWIVGFYNQGKRTGQWKEYYKGTNILCRTEYWRNDKLNGIRTRYDRNGNIIEEIQFKDGVAVLKKNYDRNKGLEWVRKPLSGDTVYTEVFNRFGALLASGNEIIYNPGNLEWFQNIELTALNTMMVQTRDQPNRNGLINREFQAFTPLVQYQKEGEWNFYGAWKPDMKESDERNWLSTLDQQYSVFRYDFNLVYQNFNDDYNGGYVDSIHAEFSNGHLLDFESYSSASNQHYAFEYHEQVLFPTYQVGRQIIHQPLKAYGRLNRNDSRIGDWVFLDHTGAMTKEITFHRPESKTYIAQRVAKPATYRVHPLAMARN